MAVTQKCSSCGADIVWIRTERGRSMPCDAKIQTVLTLEGKAVRGYTSHFSSCPNAATHRKAKPAGGEGETPVV